MDKLRITSICHGSLATVHLKDPDSRLELELFTYHVYLGTVIHWSSTIPYKLFYKNGVKKYKEKYKAEIIY